MAVTLTTSPQQIGSYASMSGERSYRYYFYAQYTPLDNGQVRLTFTFRVASTGEEGCSISGTKFYVTVDGETYNTSNLSISVPKRASQYVASWTGYLGNLTVDVDYDSDGTWANKAITFKMTGGSGTYSGGGSMDNAGCGTVSDTITLPPLPKVTIDSVTVQEADFNGYAVAGFTKLRVTMTINRANSAQLTASSDLIGMTQNFALSITAGATSQTVTQDLVVFGSASDYILSLKATVTNSMGSTSVTKTSTDFSILAIKGYANPTYGNATYTSRCDNTGTADPQGDFGLLHLTFNVAEVDSSNPNEIQSHTVSVNGTPIEEFVSYLNGLHPKYALSNSNVLQIEDLSDADLNFFITGAILFFGTNDGDIDVAQTTISSVSTTDTTTTIVLADAVSASVSDFVSIGAKISGSYTLGYFDYIIGLAQNTQGDLTIYMVDEIYHNTITSLTISKAIMPVCFYQEDGSVGMAIGRMATSPGLWIYEQMYYKDPAGSTIYPVEIEDGHLVVSGASASLPYLTVREVSATISKAVGSSVSLTAPDVTNYTFVGWLSVSTYGWQASVYNGNNNQSTTVYVAANSGSTSGTGTVRGYALYQRSLT